MGPSTLRLPSKTPQNTCAANGDHLALQLESSTEKLDITPSPVTILPIAGARQWQGRCWLPCSFRTATPTTPTSTARTGHHPRANPPRFREAGVTMDNMPISFPTALTCVCVGADARHPTPADCELSARLRAKPVCLHLRYRTTACGHRPRRAHGGVPRPTRMTPMRRRSSWLPRATCGSMDSTLGASPTCGPCRLSRWECGNMEWDAWGGLEARCVAACRVAGQTLEVGWLRRHKLCEECLEWLEG